MKKKKKKKKKKRKKKVWFPDVFPVSHLASKV